MQIKGLKKEFIDAIIDERNANGFYASLREFLERVDAEPAQTRLLIKAGCFDNIAGEVTRPGLLWRLYAREGFSHSTQAKRLLFLHTPRALPIPPEYDGNQKIKDEIELFGFPLSKHPLELYQTCLKGLQFVAASEMHLYVGKQVQMLGWLITEKFAETNSGQPMEFAVFEDLTGLYDVTFFPVTFQKYGHLLTGGKPYLVEGLVEEDFGECTLTVKTLELFRLFDS